MDPPKLDTAGTLIDALGGNRAVGEMLGVGVSAVSNWRNRGLPGWTHLFLSREGARRGLRIDESLFVTRSRANCGEAER